MGGEIWYHILIPQGSYDIEDINRVIQQKITQNRHAANVTISANTNTLKAVLILENNYHVNFRSDHSICSLLGFNHAVYTNYTSDYQESENPVNILSVNSVLVNIDIISGSYLNGLRNVEFYLYSTVSTALIYLLKPESNKWDRIKFGERSNWVVRGIYGNH